MVLQELEDDEQTVISSWQNVKELLRSTCKKVLGPRKLHQKEWITTKTLKKDKR
jgi:hypothetical protein